MSTKTNDGKPEKFAFGQWLASTLATLVEEQDSVRSLDALLAALAEKLPEGEESHKDSITRVVIMKVVDDRYFKGRLPLLRDAAAARIDAAMLHQTLQEHSEVSLPIPPQWLLAEKLKDMRGRVEAPRVDIKTIRGILRVPFTNAEEHSFKPTSYDAPFPALPDHATDKVRIGVISGTQMGLPYDPDIYQNIVRNGLSAARKLGCDAVIMGGGLFRIIFQKTAGPTRLINDMLSGGSDIDLKWYAENYREEVQRIVESGELEPIFTTAVERLNRIKGAWYKVALRPGRKKDDPPVPEFKNPVYIVLNEDDIALIRAMAYFDLLYKQHRRWLEAEAVARQKAKKASFYFRLGDMVHYKLAQAEADEAAIAASRFRMTNLESVQNRKFFKRALGFLVKEIEDSIPGAKVIALENAFMRFGKSKHVLQVLSTKKSVHIKALKNYGPAQRQGKLPDLTISMHPGAEYMRKGSRENYKVTGKMLGTAGFVEAPILVDKDAVLSALSGAPSKLPVVSAVSGSMFDPGMMLIDLDDRFKPDADFLSNANVRSSGQPKVSRAPAKYVWLAVLTDPHLGAANRLWLRNDLGLPMGICETALELLLRSGIDKQGAAPVIGIIFADDLTQGNHFGTHLRPHHNQRTNAEVFFEVDAELRRLREVANAKLRDRGKDALIRELTDQLVMFRPPHHWGTQLKEFWRAVLDAYEPVFKGALIRARNVGAIVRGVSDFTGYRLDARDVGLINFGSGNHACKTLNNMAFEGEIVADRLQVALRKDPDLSGTDLKKLIRGPMFQDQAIGFGTLQIGEDGKEWGIHIAGTPPKRDSWYDLMHGWVQVNRQRGNISTILGGKPIVHITGDKHFFGYASAGGDHYVMGPSSTHTDAFADIAGGLPENNPGVAFIGLPIMGTDKAPVIVKHMTPAMMQAFLSSGEPFPWHEYLPNAA